MPTQAAPAPPPGAAPDAPTEKKSGWFWKLIVLGLIAAVIGAECLFAYVYVSVATEKAAAGDSGAAKRSANGDAEETAKDGEFEKHAAGGEAGEREIDLGEFSLTAFQAASNTTLLIDFHLYGTIMGQEEPGFAERYESNKHRIRDQVITTIRSAELADLTDPGLGLIKRQILEKTHRALGKPLLQGIVFSDFLVVE
ncbi:MAG TPA: flagellar basal body-associated FliL family protein, partial [Pirellulales bacterium]|nr:flagellar basal body-associated FliL family protein [Pirellulales bacterium]